MNRKKYVACNFNCHIETEGLPKVTSIYLRCETDATPAILSRDFVAQLYRATKS